MIIVKLKGGLGNQLFQYAAGRRLSLETNQDLYLDITFLKYYPLNRNQTKRVFELEPFLVSGTIFQPYYKITQFLVKYKFFYLIYFKITKLLYNLKIVDENNYMVNLKNKGNVYLEGYFQNELYFNSIKNVIKNDLSLKRSLNKINKDYLNEIVNVNSISIHVRRGDYTNVVNSSIYYICDFNYFEKAIKYITNRINDPIFFIFSDDVEWVKKSFEIDYKVFHISHNIGINSYIDLYLMSKCKHNIISNSTFSWWSAWLNEYEKKIIIRPQKWYKTAIENQYITKIPDDWISL